MNALSPQISGRGFELVHWLNNGTLAFVRKDMHIGAKPFFGTMCVDGSKQTTLFHQVTGMLPSPTGNRVLLTTGDDTVVYSIADGSVTRLRIPSSAGAKGSQNIAWSPDGSLFALMSQKENARSSESDLFIYSLGPTLEKLYQTHGQGLFKSISFNHDGQRLVYSWGDSPGVKIINRRGNLYKLQTDWSSPTFAAANHAFAYVQKDGNVYSLVIKLGIDQPKALQSYLYASTQNNIQPPSHVSWSPDGTKLLVNSCWRYDPNDIKYGWHMFDLKTGTAQTIWQSDIGSTKAENWRHPSWSPDGKKLAFIKNESNIVLVTP